MSPLRFRVVATALVLSVLSVLGGVLTAQAGMHLTSRAARAEAAFVRAGLPRGSAYVEAEGRQLRILVAGGGEGPPVSLDTPRWMESLETSLSPSATATGAKRAIVMQLETAQRMQQDLEPLLRRFEVWAFDAVNAPFPVRMSPAGATILLRPSLHLPLGQSPIPYDLPWLLERRIDATRIRMVDAFGMDYADASRRLAQAGGVPRTSTIEGLLDDAGAVSLRGHDGDILLIVGHVEQDSFVIRRADGSIARALHMDPIKEEAVRHNASVIFMGCDSYCATLYNGLVAATSDIRISQQLESALSEKTLGGFLSRLGTPDEPFVVTRESLNANRATIEFAASRRTKKVAAAAGGVVVLRVVASRWIEHGTPPEKAGEPPQPIAPSTEAR